MGFSDGIMEGSMAAVYVMVTGDFYSRIQAKAEAHLGISFDRPVITSGKKIVVLDEVSVMVLTMISVIDKWTTTASCPSQNRPDSILKTGLLGYFKQTYGSRNSDVFHEGSHQHGTV